MQGFLARCIFWILLSSLSACASFKKAEPHLFQSSAYYNFLQADFDQYVEVTTNWLWQNREFIGDDHALEIEMNAPFILHATPPAQKAILLIHGLGDSPYYFRDLGKSLQAQGFDVYTLLLPGHGSKPSDLLLPRYEDWQQIVDYYANQLKDRYPAMWLGGFSTGANLATIHLLEQGGIDALLLFSPGFQSHVPFLEKLSPLIASIREWAWLSHEDNLARYNSAALNSTIAYSDSASRVRTLLDEQHVNIPTFMVMSEADSVIDPVAVISFFENQFTHPANRMIFYGEQAPERDNIVVQSMRLEDQQISTGSHMSPLFAPDNPYYGRHGSKRMCLNGLSDSKKRLCENGQPVWFSAWGYKEPDKIHARLTWNPHFNSMLEYISGFMQTLKLPASSITARPPSTSFEATHL